MKKQISISRITSAVPVYELEDFGPGYVVETSDNERVFIAGELLGKIDEDEEYLGETITITIMNGTTDLLDVGKSGESVPIQIEKGLNFQDLKLDVGTCYSVLSEL